MTVRPRSVDWPRNLIQGCGQLRFESGASGRPCGVRSRMAEAKGANPEELRDAVHAGHLSMAWTLPLKNADVTDESTHTTTKVYFEERGGGWSIDRIDVAMEASTPLWRRPSRNTRNAKSDRASSHALSAAELHLGTTPVSFVAVGSFSHEVLCDLHARR